MRLHSSVEEQGKLAVRMAWVRVRRILDEQVVEVDRRYRFVAIGVKTRLAQRTRLVKRKAELTAA